jgi:hypothetical protein
VTTSKPDPEIENSKEIFVSQVMNRLVHRSVPMGSVPEPINQRTVAVVKRSIWRTNVMNHTETLSPIGAKAYLLSAVQRNSGGDFILQKFVKSKGTHPSFYRVFWKITAESTGFSNKHLAGWSLYSKRCFAAPPARRDENDDSMDDPLKNISRRKPSNSFEADESTRKLTSTTDR